MKSCKGTIALILANGRIKDITRKVASQRAQLYGFCLAEILHHSRKGVAERAEM
jgi:hypothetical protein